ncbi:hypothetical protein FACS1894199_15400 [Bacteroidia bacterium]|nr:hypothetical protein FACS1894199_15400 [Bacteroidia bacterium]
MNAQTSTKRENTVGYRFARLMQDILLTTPITNKGTKAEDSLKYDYAIPDISEIVYLNKIYVPPFTEYDKLEEEKAESTDTDLQEKKEDYTSLTRKQESIVRCGRDLNEKLKKLADSVFIIQGVAGCGKTTYIRKLKQENEKEVTYHVCDLETSAKFPKLCQGVTIKLSPYYDDSNVWKFISVLLLEIRNILDQGDKSDVEYRRYIEQFATHYAQIKNLETIGDDDFEDFFQLFSTFTEKRQTSLNIFRQHKMPVFQFFSSIKANIEEKFQNHNNPEDRKISVSFVAGILIRLLFCLYKIDNKKHLCVVDNIEAYIPKEPDCPIRDIEIETMIDGVSKATKEFWDILREIKHTDAPYAPCYGFLLAIRDTTIPVLPQNVIQYSEDNPNVWDISEWFCARDISKSKQDFFKDIIEQQAEEIKEYIKAYNHIMNDFSKYSWGLHNLISLMYNHNYRRINENVVEGISYISETNIKHFNNQWELANKELFDKQLPKSEEAIWSSIKHICRKFIVRNLLDYIEQKTGYLSNLTHDGNSLARKIITRLYRIEINQQNDISKKAYIYTPFIELISAILQKPCGGDVPDKELEEVAQILFKMNKIDNKDTHWNALVVIKYNTSRKYDEQQLIDVMKEIWHNKNDNKYNHGLFGVRLTDSGRFFAKIVPDFEYFACRSVPDIYLFSEASLMKNSEGLYPCVECLKTVRRKAFDCINNVIVRTNEFLKPNSANISPTSINWLYNEENSWLYKERDRNPEVHPIRILKNHIGYLKNYMVYLEKVFPGKEHKDVITKIKKELEDYIRAGKTLVEDEKNKFFFKKEETKFLYK